MKAIAVLKWASLTTAAKVIKARSIVSAMDGNANFTAPNTEPSPTLKSISAGADALEQAEEAVKENGGGVKWTKARDNREAELDTLMSQMLDYVNFASKGNAEAILSAAMELKKTAVIHKKAAAAKANA